MGVDRPLAACSDRTGKLAPYAARRHLPSVTGHHAGDPAVGRAALVAFGAAHRGVVREHRRSRKGFPNGLRRCKAPTNSQLVPSPAGIVEARPPRCRPRTTSARRGAETRAARHSTDATVTGAWRRARSLRAHAWVEPRERRRVPGPSSPRRPPIGLRAGTDGVPRRGSPRTNRNRNRGHRRGPTRAGRPAQSGPTRAGRLAQSGGAPTPTQADIWRVSADRWVAPRHDGGPRPARRPASGQPGPIAPAEARCPRAGQSRPQVAASGDRRPRDGVSPSPSPSPWPLRAPGTTVDRATRRALHDLERVTAGVEPKNRAHINDAIDG